MEIDVVIAWVNGSDPEHAAKRAAHMPAALPKSRKDQNGYLDIRFIDKDEICYCVRSIKNHAPWVRTIWLVTDNQFPQSFDREEAERQGVRVVDHRHIFRGHEKVLPTFNARTIESMIWRIEGLSEHFLYFNDDMLLTKPITPEYFFQQDKVVLRGSWKGMSSRKRATSHAQAKVNAARLAGFTDRFFSFKHVIYPMLVSVMQKEYDEHPEYFAWNIKFKFRHVTQFLPISYHNHLLIEAGRVMFASRKGLVHFSMRSLQRFFVQSLLRKMRRMKSRATFAACVNDLGLLVSRVPNFMQAMEAVTGPPLAFERFQPEAETAVETGPHAAHPAHVQMAQ